MKKTAFIYMASGFGSRFGSNKLLASYRGKALYLHGLECLLEAAEALRRMEDFQVQVIVVSQYQEILRESAALGAGTCYNGHSREGITASLRLGIMAAGEDTDLYLFSVADQPCMRTETLVSLVRGCADQGRGMACVSSGGQRGNPAVFSSAYREELLELTGDRGGSVIMNRHPEDLWTFEISGDERKDMDVREDFNG